MKIHATGLNGLETSRSASNLPLPKLNGGSFNSQKPTLIGGSCWSNEGGGGLPSTPLEDFLEVIKPSLDFDRKLEIIKKYLPF